MSNVLVVGAGNVAKEYTKVLGALDKSFTVVGRGEESAQKFESETGISVVRGGVEKFCTDNDLPEFAIVTVYPWLLAEVSRCLLDYGVKNLLVEKPGGMNREDINSVALKAEEEKAKVFIAYNRRFHSSTIAARRMIEEDGGVRSFNFEFTEWSHIINKELPANELEGWFLANSTHVVDLAYYLGGIPKTISTFVEGALDWHPIASRYSGAGSTNEGALFSYKANWASAGRWSVEIMTDKRKYLFEPLETLKLQEKGSVKIEPHELDDRLDKEFKPGFYLQTKCFLEGDTDSLITVEQHSKMARIYELMETNGYYATNDQWNSYTKMV